MEQYVLLASSTSIFSNEVQPLNTLPCTKVTEDGISTYLRDVHPWNVYWSMDSTPSHISTDAREVQSMNAPARDVTEEGILTVSRDVHPLKAPSIYLTPSHISTDAREVQSMNALAKDVTEEGILTVSREVHPSKAP